MYTTEHESETLLPQWAGVGDVMAVREAGERMRADCLSEVVGIAVLRSEFEVAEEVGLMLFSLIAAIC